MHVLGSDYVSPGAGPRRCAKRFRAAQRYVAEAIRGGPDLGEGHGPMGHFFKWKCEV